VAYSKGILHSQALSATRGGERHDIVIYKFA
jgi:hypothetical protein